jgi:carbon-monoxide dehydrogenase small subunit
MTKINLSLTINDAPRTCDVAPNAVLADVLRDTFGLQGCKIACDQAVCGACTVLLDDQPVAACATFAFAADGRSVSTVEGLPQSGVLHAVQAAFLGNAAFQCGFCTSGMIMSVVALLKANPSPDDDTIREWLGGNVCRCTGYSRILDAVRQAITANALERV